TTPPTNSPHSRLQAQRLTAPSFHGNGERFWSRHTNSSTCCRRRKLGNAFSIALGGSSQVTHQHYGRRYRAKSSYSTREAFAGDCLASSPVGPKEQNTGLVFVDPAFLLLREGGLETVRPGTPRAASPCTAVFAARKVQVPAEPHCSSRSERLPLL